MTDTGYRDAPPMASAMLEALRGLGYSAAAAIADIIDNSIAARATSVEVSFVWQGEQSAITILDNGDGMDPDQLDFAMRLGNRNPLETRDPSDLGRFGLGLKTASFSQCRRLTVGSSRNGVCSFLHWDLDVLANSPDGSWRLMEGPATGTEDYIGRLAASRSGTIVVWDRLDRIVAPEFGEQNFLDLIDQVERHLAMVFHRYLGEPSPLRITVNGRAVSPWDPFLASHPATWRSPIERLRTGHGTIEVQCYVLPHKDKLDAKTYEYAAGPDGWTAQQGFYVHRNRRLLIGGSWLGLGLGRAWTKEEAHRLARIRVDIPNTADFAWKIDIRKSTARPPVGIRERLIRLAEDTRARARRVFAHRGHVASGGTSPLISVWTTIRSADALTYRIDETHLAISSVLSEAGPLQEGVRAMLRVIEETVPVQRIWLDTAEAKEPPRTGFTLAPPEDVERVLGIIYRNLVSRKGVAPELARTQLLSMEPFNQYPELVAGLPDEPSLPE